MALRRAVLWLACVLGAAACQSDLDPRLPHEPPKVAGGKPEFAAAVMRRYGCSSCHTIPGVQGADALVGPPLAGFAHRQYIAGRLPNEPETLVRWIMTPQELKPGTAMPNLGVSDQDARNMAAYLYTLEE